MKLWKILALVGAGVLGFMWLKKRGARKALPRVATSSGGVITAGPTYAEQRAAEITRLAKVAEVQPGTTAFAGLAGLNGPAIDGDVW